MQKIKIYFLMAVIILLHQGCCDDDCPPADNNNPPAGIVGEWDWIKSVGGFAGWTLTPASEGYTLAITLDELYYAEFKNDSLILKQQYDLEIRPDSFYGINTYLILENGFEFAYHINQDTLTLWEICSDCYEHTYVRD